MFESKKLLSIELFIAVDRRRKKKMFNQLYRRPNWINWIQFSIAMRQCGYRWNGMKVLSKENCRFINYFTIIFIIYSFCLLSCDRLQSLVFPFDEKMGNVVLFTFFRGGKKLWIPNFLYIITSTWFDEWKFTHNFAYTRTCTHGSDEDMVFMYSKKKSK